MPLKLNAFSGGSVTLNPASTVSDFTLTLPAATGTVVHADTNGRVGIGTAAPGFLLTVNGQASLSQIILPNVTNYITAPAVGSAIVFEAGGASRAAVLAGGDFQFNSGYGSVATAYGCRAWVNFNGTGTVAIRASGNVSSIGDNGAGDYTVNLATAMPDVNYAIAHGRSDAFTGRTVTSHILDGQTTTSLRLISRVSFSNSYDTAEDALNVYVAVFR